MSKRKNIKLGSSISMYQIYSVRINKGYLYILFIIFNHAKRTQQFIEINIKSQPNRHPSILRSISYQHIKRDQVL